MIFATNTILMWTLNKIKFVESRFFFVSLQVVNYDKKTQKKETFLSD